ncbi:MAG: hybrid sensor histidine kinase/response regulator [Planctomycetaceae bacterium]
MEESIAENELRVLMIASSRHDADITAKIFKDEGLPYFFCADVPQLCEEVERGCGVAVLSPEVLAHGNGPRLLKLLAEQPAWSDLPIVFVARGNHERLPLLYEYGNVTILQPPLRFITLLSAIRSSMISRRKQYELRDLLVREANSQLLMRQADRRKDELIATIAHELRNPLAPLKNALQLMEMAGDDAQGNANLRSIMARQVEQMIRIVEDLLDVSRIANGRIRVVRSPIDLQDSLRSAIESVRPFIEQSNQTLHLELCDEPIFVNADRARLAQVAANLLNNAAKYTPAGGNIWLTVAQADGKVTLEVRDDGIGIRAEQIGSIFEMFKQHDADSERGKAGLGIGLALVKSLVELHDGSIRVASPGKDLGSTFTVELPTCEPQRSTHSPGTESSGVNAVRSFKVLVVDDTPANRLMLQRLLGAMGHDVAVASDGAEGLELARKLVPEVIFSDIEMPKMGGYQLAKTLRQDKQFENTTLIALTGYSQDKDRQQSLDSGFDDYMTKPIDVRDLRQQFARLSGSTL